MTPDACTSCLAALRGAYSRAQKLTWSRHSWVHCRPLSSTCPAEAAAPAANGMQLTHFSLPSYNCACCIAHALEAVKELNMLVQNAQDLLQQQATCMLTMPESWVGRHPAVAHLWHLCPGVCLCVLYDGVALHCQQPLDDLLVGVVRRPAASKLRLLLQLQLRRKRLPALLCLATSSAVATACCPASKRLWIAWRLARAKQGAAAAARAGFALVLVRRSSSKRWRLTAAPTLLLLLLRLLLAVCSAAAGDATQHWCSPQHDYFSTRVAALQLHAQLLNQHPV